MGMWPVLILFELAGFVIIFLGWYLWRINWKLTVSIGLRRIRVAISGYLRRTDWKTVTGFSLFWLAAALLAGLLVVMGMPLLVLFELAGFVIVFLGWYLWRINWK